MSDCLGNLFLDAHNEQKTYKLPIHSIRMAFETKEPAKNDLGITVKKSEDFSEWYQQAIIKSELIEYGPVSGCMIIRPYGYAIWEKAQAFFDKEIKKRGIKNAYFPLLIPESLFNKEKEHVAGFSPEVAWVTHGGNSLLPERLGIRPTSETIMYDSYRKWIRSHRDLPILINQWCNIVRWEFKHPVPFLRTREFLWQEGHTAHATSKETQEMVLNIVELYRQLFEDVYAVAVWKGMKSEQEKFAGAVYTTSVETLFPNGKAIQGATSHFLGQNFSKSFDINFLNESGEREYAWQTSWGFSTRSIGMMLGIHGDDKGLIIPPRVAPILVVIVPIIFDNTMDKVLAASRTLQEELSVSTYHGEALSVFIDDSDYKPGWKFNQWELKGVPLRIELGPKDLEKGHAILVRRDTGEKIVVALRDIATSVPKLLDAIQEHLLFKSKKLLEESVVAAIDMKQFSEVINEKKVVFAPFCNNSECEDNIKAATGAKTLNSPLDQKNPVMKCISCGGETRTLFYFGKSY